MEQTTTIATSGFMTFITDAIQWLVSAITGLTIYQVLVAFAMQLVTTLVAAFGLSILASQIIVGVLAVGVVVATIFATIYAVRGIKWIVKWAMAKGRALFAGPKAVAAAAA